MTISAVSAIIFIYLFVLETLALTHGDKSKRIKNKQQQKHCPSRIKMLFNKTTQSVDFCCRCFWDRVFVCSPGCSGTHCVVQDDPNSKRFSCLCLRSADTKGMRHHVRPCSYNKLSLNNWFWCKITKKGIISFNVIRRMFYNLYIFVLIRVKEPIKWKFM